MNPQVLRILDANANRAREALRVMEDYTRFVLDDDALCGALKQLRHDLAAATAPWGAAAMLQRDTPGDVGTATKTVSESVREDLAAVVIAAGKRLGEALRTIEEYLKTVSRADAGLVEGIRYRFYDLEQRIARTLRPTGCFARVGLYVLITESICKRPWLEVARAAIAGGADCLQLREKNLDSGELLRRASALVALCREHAVLCIINDRPDIALLSNADGLHVGQTDLPAIEARKILGPDKILGVSTHDIEQAKQAILDGADYIGVGPVFRSSTKTREILPGLDFARQAAEKVGIPAVAIAGITLENVDEVLATGVGAIAVTAAVVNSDDPEAAARGLKERIVNRKISVAHGGNGGADILVCPSKPSDSQKASSHSSSTHILDKSAAPPASSLPQFRSHSRRLPHWRLDGATYFITFRVKTGELRAAERTLILEHLRTGDPKFYTLLAAVVMPDHVHILLRPAQGVELERIMKGTKGATARKVNDVRAVRGHLWQDECWDRIMRDQAELNEKIEYCLNNPVKKGLVVDPWDYPWWFYKSDQD
jgi:thiamine-phosphate pyrophosphorylase